MTEAEYKELIYKRVELIENLDQLNGLIKEIMEYDHDYGTIVYGCYAAMKAAFKVVNNSPNGGITGFQASCLGWEATKDFLSIRGPAKILDYDNLLFPQYEDDFKKTISVETWKHLQDKAAKELKIGGGSPEVQKHWESIVAGKIPFGFTLKADT